MSTSSDVMDWDSFGILVCFKFPRPPVPLGSRIGRGVLIPRDGHSINAVQVASKSPQAPVFPNALSMDLVLELLGVVDRCLIDDFSDVQQAVVTLRGGRLGMTHHGLWLLSHGLSRPKCMASPTIACEPTGPVPVIPVYKFELSWLPPSSRILQPGRRIFYPYPTCRVSFLPPWKTSAGDLPPRAGDATLLISSRPVLQSTPSSMFFFIVSLHLLTALSARPLLWELYADDVSLITFFPCSHSVNPARKAGPSSALTLLG